MKIPWMDNLIANENFLKAFNFELHQYVLFNGRALEPCSLQYVCCTSHHTNLKHAYI